MDTNTIIAQLGISGIFCIAVAIIARTFYQHYEDEIKYLRAKVDCLEAELMQVHKSLADKGIR